MWGGGDKAHKNNNVPMYSIRKITFTNMKEHTYVINFKLKEGSERKSKY